MATQLRLKVSEEKVRETIETLTTNISKMKDRVEQIQAHRANLEKVYVGPTAEKGILAIKEHEQKAIEQIEKLTKQKDALVQYLDLMNNTDSKITNDYEQAMSQAKNLFV